MAHIVDCPPAAIPDKEVTGGRPALVYWNIRGLGQPIRFCLVQAGVEFDDVRVEAGKAGTEGYKQGWMGEKERIGGSVPFVNLPYMVDGDLKLSESGAILRHVARKYGLYGPNPAVTDMVLDVAADLDGQMTRLVYATWETEKEPFCKAAPAKLAMLSGYLKEAPYFASTDAPTVADFRVYEMLYKLECIAGKEVFAPFANLAAFRERIEALPNIARYLASDSYRAGPLNNDHAKLK